MRKLLILLALLGGVALYLYTARGPVGRAVGVARTWMVPEDTGLLAFLPAKTPFVAVGQLPLVQLPENQQLTTELTRVRQEVLAKSGVDLLMDVDAVAFTDRVQVARGRFRFGELTEKLALEGYVLDEDGPTPLLKKGNNALAAVRPYLLYGNVADVKTALADQRAGNGLVQDLRMVALLKEAGWRSATLGATRTPEGQAGPVPFVKHAHAAISALLGNYRFSALLVSPTTEQGREMETGLKDIRAKLIEDLRRGGTKQTQELADALAASDIDFDEKTNGLSLFLKVPISAFSDGVEKATQNVVGVSLASKFLNRQPVAATEVDVTLNDEQLTGLNALVRDLCENGIRDCTQQKRSDLLNAAIAFKQAGKSDAAIRANLLDHSVGTPQAPAAADGIGVDNATYGGNCGARGGNASAKVMAACNGKKACRYVVDVDVLGDPSPNCAKDFNVTWTCGTRWRPYFANIPAEAGTQKTVSLSCD